MAFKTIILKPELNMVTGRGEAVAESAITPGDILEFTATGTVQRRSTGALNSLFMVAIENSMFGDEIDTDYVAGDLVQYAILQAGNEAYCWLADGADVVVGEEIEFSTGGSLTQRASGISIATASEAVDLTDSANLTDRGRVKVIVN